MYADSGHLAQQIIPKRSKRIDEEESTRKRGKKNRRRDYNESSQ